MQRLGVRNAWFDCGYMFCFIQGGFWKNFYDFPSDWVDSDPEVNSRRSLLTCLRFPGFACDAPRAVFPIAGLFLLLSSCTWKSVHYFYEPSVFSAFSAVEILRWSIFWGPRALTTVSARGPVVPESPGVYSQVTRHQVFAY